MEMNLVRFRDKKICPLMLSALLYPRPNNEWAILCGEDGNVIVEIGYDFWTYPCAGWKNGKCAFMRE